MVVPAYLGGISYLASVEASRGTPRLEPEKGTVDMDFFQACARQVTFDDVTLEEVERRYTELRNRKLALDLLDLKKDEQWGFLDRLKETNQDEPLLTDVLHFLKLTDAERPAGAGEDPAGGGGAPRDRTGRGRQGGARPRQDAAAQTARVVLSASTCSTRRAASTCASTCRS